MEKKQRPSIDRKDHLAVFNSPDNRRISHARSDGGYGQPTAGSVLNPSNADPDQRKSFDERLIDPYRQSDTLQDTQNRGMLLTPDYKANRQSRRMDRISRVLQDPEVQQQIAQIRTHRPYFLWFMTFAQVVAMIVLIGINQQLFGSLIETSPFNVMIGPSAYTLIRSGARFVPCMKSPTLLTGKPIACPVALRPRGSETCTINDICGIAADETPNQWWRFVLPIFLHGGVLHLLFNILFQVQVGFQMERDFGWWRVAAIYFLSGIFGFIFGANFALQTSPSVGSSGALFGLVGCLVIDLVNNWKIVLHPRKELLKLVVIILVSFAIGLMPGIDNFSHIGGFIMGILAGFVFIPRLNFGKWDKRRKHILMMISVPLIIILMAGMLVAFYKNDASRFCPWCKYLNCAPFGGMCDVTGVQ